ncbi:LiaF transmembrane domain-containing protein [Caproicibacter sp.]|uniref:LiaF transmembrane domain-containing protein n=1 Tax=Caproicibacter sp. TaxID=2814884 RepID=UPI0039895F26
MKHRNWFWGIFFLAAAIFVIASQIGAFIQIGFWSVAATVLLAAVLISSLTDLNWFGMFISIALLYLIYQQPFHLVVFSFWQLMVAALFASIGFSMIFHSRRHYWGWCHHGWDGDSHPRSEENIDGNEILVKTSFSESCKYLHSDSLKSANLSSSFGKLSVYFDQVQLSPEGAEIRIDESFGEMVLYLHRNWRIVDHVHAAFGAVNSDRNDVQAEPGAPAVTLTGSVSFGNLSIRYV